MTDTQQDSGDDRVLSRFSPGSVHCPACGNLAIAWFTNDQEQAEAMDAMASHLHTVHRWQADTG